MTDGASSANATLLLRAFFVNDAESSLSADPRFRPAGSDARVFRRSGFGAGAGFGNDLRAAGFVSCLAAATEAGGTRVGFLAQGVGELEAWLGGGDAMAVSRFAAPAFAAGLLAPAGMFSI